MSAIFTLSIIQRPVFLCLAAMFQEVTVVVDLLVGFYTTNNNI